MSATDRAHRRVDEATSVLHPQNGAGSPRNVHHRGRRGGGAGAQHLEVPRLGEMQIVAAAHVGRVLDAAILEVDQVAVVLHLELVPAVRRDELPALRESPAGQQGARGGRPQRLTVGAVLVGLEQKMQGIARASSGTMA